MCFLFKNYAVIRSPLLYNPRICHIIIHTVPSIPPFSFFPYQILGLTAGSTAWVGGSEADPAGEALMACLDRTGSGALTLRDLERFLRLPSGSVGALGVLWKRLREGVEASAKHNCETIDLQLFAKYAPLELHLYFVSFAVPHILSRNHAHMLKRKLRLNCV